MPSRDEGFGLVLPGGDGAGLAVHRFGSRRRGRRDRRRRDRPARRSGSCRRSRGARHWNFCSIAISAARWASRGVGASSASSAMRVSCGRLLTLLANAFDHRLLRAPVLGVRVAGIVRSRTLCHVAICRPRDTRDRTSLWRPECGRHRDVPRTGGRRLALGHRDDRRRRRRPADRAAGNDDGLGGRADDLLSPAGQRSVQVVAGSSEDGLARHVGESSDLAHVHAVFSHSSIAAGRACRAARVPYIVRPLGTLDPWSLGRRRVAKQALRGLGVRRLLRDAACMHYTSVDEQRLAEQSSGPLPRGVVVPIGIENDLFEQAASPDVSRTIVTLCRLDEKKGIDVLIQAFAAVVAAQSDLNRWRLVIAGSGDPGRNNTSIDCERSPMPARLEMRLSLRRWLAGSAKGEPAAIGGAVCIAVPPGELWHLGRGSSGVRSAGPRFARREPCGADRRGRRGAGLHLVPMTRCRRRRSRRPWPTTPIAVSAVATRRVFLPIAFAGRPSRGNSRRCTTA